MCTEHPFQRDYKKLSVTDARINCNNNMQISRPLFHTNDECTRLFRRIFSVRGRLEECYKVLRALLPVMSVLGERVSSVLEGSWGRGGRRYEGRCMSGPVGRSVRGVILECRG